MSDKDPYSYPTLAERIVKGEVAAFDQLFTEMHPALFIAANQITRNEEYTRDILSEVFLQLWEKRASLSQVKDLNAWLYVAVRHRTLNYLRDLRRGQQREERLATAEETAPVSPDFLQAIFDAETIRMLRSAIRTLPTECRKVVQLGMEGYSTSEIAVHLQISPSAVSHQKARAIKLLREQLPPTLLMAYLFWID